MARAWVTDLWVKDAHALMPDGSKVRISPTAPELRNIRSLPEHFRTARYGTGKRWRVGWYERDGRTRTRHFEAKADAERYQAELEDNLRTGRYAPPELTEQPFRQLADTWLASKRSIKPSTTGGYEGDLAVHIIPKWGDTPINAITRPMLEEWVRELEAGTAPREYSGRATGRAQGPLAPRTIRLIVKKTFGAAMRYALDEGWIARDPLKRLELPRPTMSEALSILDFEETERLAAAAKIVSGKQRDRALIHLLAASGPRINEALALQVGDIRVGARRAQINRTWTRDKKGRRDIGPPKTWEKRSIPIPDYVLDELAPLIKGRPNDAWLFRADRGNAALDHKNWYNRVWLKAVELAGLDSEEYGLTIHKLRHTAASAAIAAGADVIVVQQMLGHRNATETLNVYSHLWPDRLDEVLDKTSQARKKALALAA